MCTTIGDAASITGSAKGPSGWFTFDRVWLSYDHPFHVQIEHAVTVDLVDDSSAKGGRIAIELSREQARTLALRLMSVVDAADAFERV